MVLLINPYYLVLHVQFIDTSRKFIMIDRKIWNKTIASFNRIHKLDPSDIRRFKKEIYNMYIIYMKKGKIDYDKFNKMCCEILHIEYSQVNLDEIVMEDEIQIIHEEGKIEESPYFENSSTSIVSLISNGLLDHSFGRTVSTVRNINSLLDQDWNTLMIANKDCDDLLNFVGFNRTRSIISQIITNKAVKLHTKEEYVVVFMFRDLIINILGDSQTFELMFFCSECLTINCHNKKAFGRSKIQMIEDDIQDHNNKIKFFDYSQMYAESNKGFGMEMKIGFEIDGKHIDTKVFHKDTEYNPGKYRKYHRQKLELVKKYKSLIKIDFFTQTINDVEFKDFINSLPIVESYYYDNRIVGWEIENIFITDNWELDSKKVLKHKEKVVVSQPKLFGKNNKFGNNNVGFGKGSWK